MGIYPKKGTSRWWMNYKNAAGEWVDESTGERDETAARAVHDTVVASIAKGEAPDRGPMTVRRFADTWIKERRDRGLEAVDDDDARVRDHVLPALGDVLLSELTARQVQAWVRDLKKKKSERTEELLAPRTVRHCFNLLRTMMTDAIADEKIEFNPCVLKKGDLPRKKDKNPEWRATAVFARSEVELLISHPEVPEDERVWIGLHFLSGARPGEGSALRVRDYDRASTPLHRITISKAMDRKRKRVKGTKTEIPRDVPVHPTLAAMLADWLLRGWQKMMGRPPKPDDLLVPARPSDADLRNTNYVPKPRSNSTGLKQFHRRLEQLGLKVEGPKPWRRFYDSRRTFISLALADGARKDILRWVTHPAYEDQMDEYTSIPFAAKCAEVAKLKVELRAGELVQLPKVANSLERPENLPTALPTAGEQAKKKPVSSNAYGPKSGGVYGTRSCGERPLGPLESNSPDEVTRGCAACRAPPGSVEANQPDPACRNCRKPRLKRGGIGGRPRKLAVEVRWRR